VDYLLELYQKFHNWTPDYENDNWGEQALSVKAEREGVAREEFKKLSH